MKHQLSNKKIYTTLMILYKIIQLKITIQKKINTKYEDKKITKKDSTVNNYTQLYNKIEEIKTTSTNHEEIITLNPGNYNITETINWGNTTHTTKTLTIKANNITIDGQNQKQFITITNGYTLILENMIIQNCNSTNGSVIFNEGRTIITNSTFKNNNAECGGVNYNHGIMNIANSTFNRNNAEFGGVNTNVGSMNIFNSIFNNNTAYEGGVNYNNGTISIINSTFNNNYGNYSGVNENNKGFMNVIESNFTNNSAGYNGGANINHEDAILNIRNSTFIKNKAQYMGGCNFNEGNISITNSTFKNNTAEWGAVNYNNYNKMEIINSTFNTNHAERGGVNYNVYQMTIINSNFTKNSVLSFGGAIYNYGESINITNSTFNENMAESGGAAIYNEYGSININKSIFTNNFDNNNITIINLDNFTMIDSSISNYYGTYNVTSNITITSPISDTQLNTTSTVQFIIENQTYNTNKNNENIIQIEKQFNNPGNQIVLVKYPNMQTNQINLKYTIQGNIQNTTLPSETIKTLTNKTLTININDTQNNPLKGEITAKIKIDNIKIITTKINEGLLNVTIPTDTLKSGKYKIAIEIPESEIYTPGEIIQQLTINKRDIQNITLTNKTIKTQTNHHIILTLNDTIGNKLQGSILSVVKINNATQFHTKVENEILNITLKTDDFRAKKYPILIKIGENNYYNQGIITQNLIIENRNSNITINTNTPTVKEQLYVDVTVKEDKKLVNGGFVIFKINGKTLKDTQGQEIKVNVVNGIATLNYTLPNTIGGGKYNITCVYNSPFYNRQQTTKNFTIQKIDIQNTTIPEITTKQGENTTLNIQVNDTNANPIEGKTPICIKINGKTFIKTNITNGKINLTLPIDTFKNPEYQLLIIIGQTANYNQKQYTTTLKIISPNAKILREIE
ncbi:Ig-like domain-containing protein [Methanosphaera cuniculi]|nr:Ig-like domain-containing protein [Methanosphaera cuniculi]